MTDISQSDHDLIDMLGYFVERWSGASRMLLLVSYIVLIPLAILMLVAYFVSGRNAPLLIVTSVLAAVFTYLALRFNERIEQMTILLNNVREDVAFAVGAAPTDQQLRTWGDLTDDVRERLRSEIAAGMEDIKRFDKRGTRAYEASLRDRQREQACADAAGGVVDEEDRLGGY